ncbi:MAG: HAMP domain-containing sensor histidine kinase, partial [Actinomycetota bacterium]
MSVFAVVVIRLDRELRDEQVDTELLRLVEVAGREVSFVDEFLEPSTPELDGVALAVNPSFSVREFETQLERLELRNPTVDELGELMEIVFDEADPDFQAFLLGEQIAEIEFPELVDRIDLIALVDDGVAVVDDFEFEEDGETVLFERTEFFRDDVLGALLDDPPADLFDEAYRRFVVEQADAEDVELEFETSYLRADGVDLDDDTLGSISDRITDDGVAVVSDTLETPEGGARVVRAVALRDGPEVRGAVIAVLDPSEFDDAHASLRNQVILLAIALVAGSVVAAWFVAGRTTRPVARALGQQERFLADAAHELRTPIAAIRLTAEASDASTAVASLDRVAELAADASTLTDDLLTLARMDADRVQLQRDRVRLYLLVESTIAAVPGGEHACRVEAPTAVVAPVDPGLVERAITNLVRNAIAHGGASADEPAIVSVASDDHLARVRVRDHGAGLSPDMADTLFERFRTRTGSTGHGLGLPLSRWIARAHGGDLTVGAGP